VHGSVTDFRIWDPQIEPFLKYYHVIAYSRRYHYPNTWIGDGSDYSPFLHAEDLAELIKELGLSPVHVVGISYGASICLSLAAKYPELIRTSVICEPFLLSWLRDIPGGDSFVESFMTNIYEPIQRAVQSKDLEQSMRIFVDGFLGEGTFDHLPVEARTMLMDNALEMKAWALSSDIFKALTRDEARKIRTRTLILTGEFSTKPFRQMVDELERCLPNTERATIPGASHILNVDNPQAFNETVQAFLSKH